jgi:two-component system, cell cycle sensor histidine kinase and response regulator CckA
MTVSGGPADQANAVVVSFTADRRITGWNDEAARVFGWPAADVLGRLLEEVVRGEGASPIEEAVRRVLGGAPVWTCESHRQARDGSPRTILSVVMRGVPDAAGARQFTVIAHDITERVESEHRFRAAAQRQTTLLESVNARLERSERRYRDLVENLNDVVFALDNNRVMRYVSPAVEKFGYTPADLLGRPFWDIVHPDDRPALHAALQRPDRDSTQPYEFRALDAAGATRYVRTSSRDVYEDGVLTGVTGVLIDLTAQRLAEEQLRASQRLDALGRLAGGIAHDFNNLLVAIIGYAEFALDGMREWDPMRRDLEEILRAGHRAAALTHQLLAFSRKQVLTPEVINLNDVVRAMEGMLRRLIGEHIDLQASLAEGAAILADPGQVEQVIMNLVLNARDAMPDGGRLRIETAISDVPLDDPEGGRESENGWVVLTVRDTGMGMDARTKARLFEPFFSTKSQGDGTGLGLPTVYGIVRQSGGAITVESEPGQGATFRIAFPREASAPAIAVPRPRARGKNRGTETVLVVEDEEAVRHLASRFLAVSGYHVLKAASGGEALLTCERHEGPIHLLLTDVVMPQMSGRELAERLRQSRPDMRVLYMSGYSGSVIEHHQRGSDDDAPLVEKPFSGAELVKRVRGVLDESKK